MHEPEGPSSAGRDRPVDATRRPETDDLLMAAGRGDLDAFGALYDATAPTVLGMVDRVLGRPTRAERVIEEIYLVLWRRAPSFDPEVRSADATVLHTARRVLARPSGSSISGTARGVAPDPRRRRSSRGNEL